MSSRRRRVRRKHSSKRGIAAGLLTVLLASVVLVLLVGVASAAALVKTWLSDLPDYHSPTAFRMAQPTRILSADGKLLARLYLEDRTVVDISKVATDLPNAVVAIEDERFYKHNGVDPEGIVRAVLTNLRSGNLSGQGASTITMQYINNTVLLGERTDITLARKVRQAYLAMQIEKQYSKQQILNLYLNTVYFGEGAYGMESAARNYFGKHASDLTLAESAMLAGLLQGPSRLDPYEHAEAALNRRTLVLERMLANGYITKAEYEASKAEPLALKRWEEPESGIYEAPYFVAHVKKLLQQQYPQAVVFKGGLTVQTTLDTRMQHLAEKAVARNLGKSSDPDTALVAIDPRTGAIKAMYGGRDYNKSKFNLATQGKRQPGSSFKTFVLVTALEQGMPPYRYIDSSSPAYIPTKPKAWEVSNSEGHGRGLVTIETATRASINTVFARLIWEIGAAKVVKVAHKMGITSDLPNYPSIGLGSSNVTPLEMASAYGTLATNGVHYTPMAITRILDSEGKVLFSAKPEGKQALKPEIAHAATEILRGVVSGGTGTRAAIGRPQAGKTGTSQNYRDAWFVGYTPDLVTSVWVGYKTERPMLSVRGRRGFGGTLAAPIWADFVKPALEGRRKTNFADAPKPKYKYKESWLTGLKVPNVVGMSLDKAKKVLAEAGLPYTITEEYSSKVPVGRISSQSPGGGQRYSKSPSVVLRVSKGPAPVIPKPPPVVPPPPPETTTTP